MRAMPLHSIAQARAGIGHGLLGILQQAVILISDAIEAAYRLVVARTISALSFAKPRVNYAGTIALGLTGVAIGLLVCTANRHVQVRAWADVTGTLSHVFIAGPLGLAGIVEGLAIS